MMSEQDENLSSVAEHNLELAPMEGIDALVFRLAAGRSIILQKIVPLLAIVLVLFANIMVFTIVPNEAVMGAVQRIFYYHVGSASSSYLTIFLLFVASVFYLLGRKTAWDMLAQASAEVSLLLCSIVLVTGMIWGHSAWNVWWRWEPRLVSFLVLWLILFSYVVMRGFTGHDARFRNFAAVVGIISAVNVPIVIFSIKFLDQTEQLHPEVVAREGGLSDERFVWALIISILAIAVTSVWFTTVRFMGLVLAERLRRLEDDVLNMEERHA
ncbi:MAG: cytochrome c biogenesis protein [bacterium]|nr:cytochrome c biogenesis protein [bacterium]